MTIKEAKQLLRVGVNPDPAYPNRESDMTAEDLIAFDPRAELEYRMAKSNEPELTRNKLLRQWKELNLVRLWNPAEGTSKEHKEKLSKKLHVMMEKS